LSTEAKPAEPQITDRIIIKRTYNKKCILCNCPHLSEYEKAFKDSNGKISFADLEELSRKLGDNIDYAAIRRHFINHFSMITQDYLEKKSLVEQEAETTKEQTVNTLKEIRSNLEGLKNLVTKANQLQINSPSTLQALAAIYREHRMTIESCEKLTQALSASTDISRAEIIKEIFYAARDLCPECKKKFLSELDVRLKSRNIK